MEVGIHAELLANRDRLYVGKKYVLNENRDQLMSRFELCENSDQIKGNTSADGIRTG